MKTLSIQQPWAWAIVHGFKDIENRTWRTKYRGPLLIHAGKKEDTESVEYVVRMVAAQTNDLPALVIQDYIRQGHRGAVVGHARLSDCVSAHRSEWFEGPWGFVLDDAMPLQPHPYKGRLGLFDVTLTTTP